MKIHYIPNTKIHAFNDMEKGISQTWLCVYKNKTVGFISMAHMKPERHEILQGKGYGNIPSLLIGYLATHKKYEKRGIGMILIAWAIKEAINSSKRIGCRIVMLNPENDKKIKNYYTNRGFTYVPHEDREKDIFFLDIQKNGKMIG